jgi:amidase
VHGPLARTVADAAARLDAMAVASPGEPFVPAAPPPDGYLAATGRAPGRLRIALTVEPPLDGVAVDPACRRAAEDTGALLEELGHHVEPVALRLPDEAVAAFLTLWTVLSLGDPVDPDDEPRLQPLTRYLRARGREVGGAAAMAALHTVQVVTRRLVAERAAYDAVLTPTVALPPRPVGWFTAGGDPADDFARQIAFTPWTAIANLTGEPAISVPLSWADGLPIGVSLRGRRGEEALLLALAARLESARPWAGRRPPEV